MDLSPAFSKYRDTTDETFQQSKKQDFFKHIDIIYKSSDSQFFKTTTGVQSGRDTFGELRLVMTFFTNFGVTEILFRNTI